MSPNKTTLTKQSVIEFANALTDDQKKKDTLDLISLIQEGTQLKPNIWGSSIIGFGIYHYKYASGHEGDAPLISFSPRKTNFSVYLAPDFDKKELLLSQLGKFKTGVGCLYFNKLSDIDTSVLMTIISNSIDFLRKTYSVK
jgi:hypothetical protein